MQRFVAVAYGRGVTDPEGKSTFVADSDPVMDEEVESARWPTVITWREHHASRMESVRVTLVGNRIRASGRIIAGESEDHPAFSASYDLVTDEMGITKRLALRSTMATGEKAASIARDQENYWMIDAGGTHVRSTFGDAMDVDMVHSPFFNTLPIRRYGLARVADHLELPVVYVRLPELRVEEAKLTYSSGAAGIHVMSPVSSATLTVDSDGFVIDYPGLAERI